MANLLGAAGDQRRRAMAGFVMYRRMIPRRTMWVHPYNKERDTKSEFENMYKDLRKYPEKFFKMYRMYPNQFDHLFETLRPGLEKQKTNYRDPISAETRLVVTLT